jgi:phosphoglycolate phosphatase-like HAD superfamily hydrolase
MATQPMHLIVFDVDGTLTRTDDLDGDCYVQAVLEGLGIGPIETHWHRYRHVTDSGILQEILESRHGRPPSEEESRRVLRRFHELLAEAFAGGPHRCLPVAGGPETVRRLLAEPGQAVALATGGWGETARLKLRQAGYEIGHAGNAAFASADDSPVRSEIMRIAERRARAVHSVDGFETITYVGDGLWDATASAELGWRFVGVASGEQAARLQAAGARAVISGYREDFLALVRKVQAFGDGLPTAP